MKYAWMLLLMLCASMLPAQQGGHISLVATPTVIPQAEIGLDYTPAGVKMTAVFQAGTPGASIVDWSPKPGDTNYNLPKGMYWVRDDIKTWSLHGVPTGDPLVAPQGTVYVFPGMLSVLYTNGTLSGGSLLIHAAALQINITVQPQGYGVTYDAGDGDGGSDGGCSTGETAGHVWIVTVSLLVMALRTRRRLA